MNEDRLIKHKSMIHSKTYTEEDLYGQESPGWISLFKLVTFLYTET